MHRFIKILSKESELHYTTLKFCSTLLTLSCEHGDGDAGGLRGWGDDEHGDEDDGGLRGWGDEAGVNSCDGVRHEPWWGLSWSWWWSRESNSVGLVLVRNAPMSRDVELDGNMRRIGTLQASSGNLGWNKHFRTLQSRGIKDLVK